MKLRTMGDTRKWKTTTIQGSQKNHEKHAISINPKKEKKKNEVKELDSDRSNW